MTQYLVFDTQEEAEEAAKAIFAAGVHVAKDKGLDVAAARIVGVKAGRSNDEGAGTTAWAIPEQREADGKWVIAHPENFQIGKGEAIFDGLAEKVTAPVNDYSWLPFFAGKGDILRFDDSWQVVDSGGTAYRSLSPNNHFTPKEWPLGWEVVDAPTGPQPWVQPTGAHDAYAIGDEVTHPNAQDGGTVWLFRSKIAANTTEPGTDGAFHRWWEPVNPV